jgi:hypothetical protein
VRKILLLAFGGLVVAGVATQLPELKRYMKVRQM